MLHLFRFMFMSWVTVLTDAGLGTRLLAGGTTGALAVAFAQPTDVVKVRFQAQIRLPETSSLKKYSSTTDAYKIIGKDEGVRGLWKGIFIGKSFKVCCTTSYFSQHRISQTNILFVICISYRILNDLILQELMWIVYTHRENGPNWFTLYISLKINYKLVYVSSGAG